MFSDVNAMIVFATYQQLLYHHESLSSEQAPPYFSKQSDNAES